MKPLVYAKRDGVAYVVLMGYLVLLVAVNSLL